MNEEALEYVYNDYVQSGYDGSVEDFTSLLSSNNEALDLVFNDFAESGYDGSIEDFSVMLGVDKSPKKESQVKIDSRINNVNKVYQEQVDKINAGNWDDDEKVELTKRVSAARDKQLSKLEKEKDIDLYADELIEINKSVPENLNELVSDLEYEDYEDYIDAAEQKLNIEDPNIEYSQEDIERKASELYALKKYRAEQTEQALEDFESEYGIDRTKSIGSMLDVVMDFGVTGVIDTYFDAAKDIYDDHSKGKLDDVAEQWKAKKWDLVPELYERYFGTEQQKEYRKSREELHEALTIKNEKLDEKYRDDVAELTVLKNKADKDYIEFEKLQKRLKQEDPTITTEDYNRYRTLYDEIQNDKTLFDKKLERLNNSTIPSNDFETIKNLTLKTYDNLDRIDNLVSASVGRLVASTATLGNKVGLPELIKWTGIDIESEEGLNKIFGEDVDGAMGAIKDAVGVLGNINKSKNEVIQSAYDLSDSITDLNSPSMEWKNIDSVEDFAYWGGDMLAGQVVNTGLIIAFPPVGLALLAAQAAGDKMHEMDIAMEGVKGEDGEFIIEPEEYNAAQYFGSAALYGGIEYITERVTLGLVKGMLGNVSKALKLTGRSAMPRPNITLKNLSNGQAWAKFGTDIVKGIGKEGAAEGIVAITNNLTDQYVLGDKNANWANNLSESVVSGMLMGKVYSVPNIAVPIMHGFSSEGELAKANKRNAELLKLSESRNKVMSMGGDATQIQNRITEILDEQMLAMEGVRLRGIEMSPEDRQYIIDSSNDQHQLRAEIDKINNNEDIDEDTKALMINNEAAKIQEIESERERIFSSYAPKARAARETQRAKDVIEDLGISDKVDVVSVKDEAEMAKSIEDSGYSTKESKDAAAVSFGIFVPEPDSKTGKRKIILNETDIAKVDKWTTAQHETLHAVLSEVLKDATETDVLALGNAVREKLMEIDPKTLGNTDFARRFLEYRNDPADTQAEELLTLLSEAITTGDVKFNEGFFTKIQDLIRRMFQNAFPGSKFGKIKFDSAENVYKFIKDYNKSFEKGKTTKAQKAAVKQGVEVERTGKMDFGGEFLDVEFKNSKGEPVKLKLSKNIENETQQEKSKRQDKRNVDVAKIYDDRAKGKNKQEWNEFLDSARGGNVMGDLIQQYYPDMVATAIKQNAESPMDVASEAMIPLMQHIRAFDPSKNDDLAGYIGGYLGLKVGTAGKRVAKKTATLSMEQEGVRQVAEKQAVEQTSSKEAPVREGIVLADRLRGKAKEAVEKIESKVNTKALTEAKEIGPITKEEQIEYLESQTYKTLKDLVSNETQEMFGITPKPGNLTKQDIKNAQMFIASNVDALISMLPEGSTPSGTATGVQKVLLDAFYTKRDKKVKLATTGSKAGLKPFVKNSNIDPAKFLEIFGITKKGKQNLYKKESNTSSRIKALVEQTGRLITNQTVRQAVPQATKVGEGKSKLMFSKATKYQAMQVQNVGSSFNKLSTENQIEFNSKLDDFINALSVGYSVDAAFQEAYGDFLNKKDGKPNNQRIEIIQGWKKVNDFIFDQQRKLNDGKPNIDKVQEYLYQSFSEQTERQVYQEILGLKKRSIDFSNREQIISYVSALSEFIGSKVQDGRLRTDRDLVDYAENVLGPLLTSSSKVGDGSLKWNFENNVWDLIDSGKKGSTRYSVFRNKGEMMDVLIEPFLKDKESYEWKESESISKDGVKTKSGKLLYKGESLLNNEFKGFRSQTPNLYLKDYAADGKISNRTLNKSETFAKFNRSTVLEILEFLKEKSNDPESQINKNDLGMFFMESNGDMKAPLRASANVDGIAVDESLKPSNYRYEHNPPARTMLVHMANYVNGKIDLDQLNKEFDNFSVTIIPLSMDEVINLKYKDTIPIGGETRKYRRYYNTFTFGAFPFSTIEYVKQDNGTYKQVVHGEYQAEAYKKVQPAKKKNVTALKKSKVVKTSDQVPNSEDIRQAEVLDKALNIARDPNAPVKKIRVFDFDDTLARTKSNVLYTMPDGTTGKLTAEEFAKKGDKMLAEGAVWDFSEFNKVMEGREGPLLGVAKLIQQARGTKDVFVLTARAQEAAPAIKEFLDSVGLNIPIENITGLGDSSPLAKSNWIVDKAADGYNDFYFADDHMGNVDAVQKALAVMEAKAKVQQAKIKFSLNTKRDLKWKTIGGSFNIVEADFEVAGKDYQIEIKRKDVGHIFSKLDEHFGAFTWEDRGRDQQIIEDNLTKKELGGAKPKILDTSFYRITDNFYTGIEKDVDLTGEGNAAEVISIVVNGLVDKYKKTKGAQGVTFTAYEPSRTRLYRALANMFGQKLGLKVLETEGNVKSDVPTEFVLLDKNLFEAVKETPTIKFSKQPKPVQTVLDTIDTKSDVQRSKLKFSKTVDQMMNNIIYEKTGIEQYKEFSEIAAQARGRKKKSWNLIPPSAQDFGGLLYKLLAKGKQGDTQWEWMQEHLIKPYGRAMNDLSVAQNQLMADFKALKESLIGVPKNLKKEAFGGFTNEDVVRVATWDRQGIKIDGISKRDLEAVRKYVANKPDLNIFIDQLIAITKGDGYYYPGKNWLAGTITTDFREGLRKVTRKNLLEQWQANVDLAFNENTMNKLEAAFGPKYREALENSLERMSSGQNRRQGMSRIEQRFLDYINNSVGAVMFLNARSAVLQTISAVNFINWKDNNPMKAALAFANQKQYWSDFMTLMNSDFLVDRRNGLKINVSESEIAEAAKTSKNTVKGVITYLLNKGFAFTQIADSFAIATGGATMYRNRIKTYKKQGLSEAEATEKAFLEFRELAEESQQSARADKISQQQASTLGRLVLAFANTPSQYARIMDKAGRDLINNRGDWKANMSKIAYYGFVQNLLFTTLQSALFAYGMDDDEEEDMKVFPEDKMLDAANSMADNILRGMGVAGVVLAQSKNTIIDLIKRSQKDPYFNPDAKFFPGPNYEDAVMKLLAISPPVSIKFRKIKGGITDWYFNRWRPEASEPFNINNPSYRAGSKVIAGVSNVPLDRLFQKLENIQGTLDDTNPLWQRVFMALGWPKWQLETEKAKEERKAKEKKQKRDIKAKDNPSVYNKDEQVSILKQYKLTDEQIKELKNEALRVSKIQELRKKTKRIYVPK